uniref:Uncharacterized protein n=1 Tax=viral metagenome TaxID=1070528 RepID=A0A6C0I3B5_9ZZZZ
MSNDADKVINKLKKIQKKKMANYKNIPVLDVLSNTEPGDTTLEVEGNSGPAVIEGMIDMINTTCQDNPDYEGCDNTKDDDGMENPLETLAKFIETTYDFMNALISVLALNVCLAILVADDKKNKIYTEVTHKRVLKQDIPKQQQLLRDSYNQMFTWRNFGKKKKKYQLMTVKDTVTVPSMNDFQEVKKHLSWFTAVTVSCYFVYNWYFLLIYENPIRFKNGPDTLDLSMQAMKERAKTNPVFVLFNIFFSCSWIFVAIVDQYFIKLPVSIITHYMNSTLCFCLFFFFCIQVCYYYPFFLKTFIVDSLRFNWKNTWIITMTTLAMVYYIINCLDPENPIPWITIFGISVILGIILFLVLGIFIGLFAAPVAGMFLFAYFFLYSNFAIFIYGIANVRNVFSIFGSIEEHAKVVKSKIKKGTDALPNTLMERFWLAVNDIMDFLYHYIFYVAYLIILFYASVDYQSKIESRTLKSGLILVNMTLLLIICTMCLSDFYSRFKHSSDFLIQSMMPSQTVDASVSTPESSITSISNLVSESDVKEKMNDLKHSLEKSASHVSNFFSGVMAKVSGNKPTTVAPTAVAPTAVAPTSVNPAVPN